MEEVWKEIQGFDLPYRISNTGKVINQKGKLMVSLKNADIYLVTLRKDKKQRRVTIHRLVAHYFLGVDLNDSTLVVKHKDGNVLNNCVDNLEVSTRLNQKNKRQEKLNPSGVKNISWYPQLGKWKVSYRIRRKKQEFFKHIGYFNLLEDAKNVHELWFGSFKKIIPKVKYPGLLYLEGEHKWRVDVFDYEGNIYHIDHYLDEKEALEDWELYTGILRQS
jgi:hypothetical protein